MYMIKKHSNLKFLDLSYYKCNIGLNNYCLENYCLENYCLENNCLENKI